MDQEAPWVNPLSLRLSFINKLDWTLNLTFLHFPVFIRKTHMLWFKRLPELTPSDLGCLS